VKLIAASFKKIVARSAPRPLTRIALLNQMTLPSAIGTGLKLNSIELSAVHVPALTPEDSLGSDDRSDTFDVVLSARFAAALFSARFAAALFTAPVAALFGERTNDRKFPLARDTRAKPTARDRIPSPIRHLRDGPERVSRGRRVSICVSPFSIFAGRL
jgi:hypothetical protein